MATRQGHEAYKVSTFKMVPNNSGKGSAIAFLTPKIEYWTVGKSIASTGRYSISIIPNGDKYKLGGISYLARVDGKWKHRPGRVFNDFGGSRKFRDMCNEVLSRVSLPTIFNELSSKKLRFREYKFPSPLKVIFGPDGKVKEVVME